MTNKTTVHIHSRRNFLKVAGQSTAAMALMTGCSLSSTNENSPIIATPIDNHKPNKPASEIPTPDNMDKPAPDDVDETTSVSLETKIGQMLLVGFRGLTVEQSDVRDILDLQIGGVLLFDYDVARHKPVRNIQSPQQVKALVDALQAYTEIPLLIGIDYEGGVVNRLPEKYGFPPTVSHQYLGRKGDLTLTHQYATKMAETLTGLGINLNFAPVVDVNTNPSNPIIGKIERSFSADPQIVTDHALEYIRAFRQHNVICTLKHFPGHGSSQADSHRGIADVTNTWAEIELIPYRQLIQTGEVDSIMTAHVFNQTLDPNYPATLSKPVITDLLRGELGFDGVVFSDDMQMKAIASHYGLEIAIQKAIEAGVDILVIGNNMGDFVPDIAVRVTTIIKQLVQNGTISPTRIDESYQRILKLKYKMGIV
ncbi:glycoside hydrolase family 3 N-terminal domain-containing protein [Candidatus Parabeggiatoa sp. HSG14]|uniref:glycoside hydrolase family 3 N-terminal domain-containing protein n=1 Tax=Candidatus Parabeggiatoa sp. HSG14 TaxID=3055593 RepID=UPI0025A90A91|nr:glycoside hydrolase family 3 N-terminal domain-containing protein [Thiotrichales bacterium HSG14]